MQRLTATRGTRMLDSTSNSSRHNMHSPTSQSSLTSLACAWTLFFILAQPPQFLPAGPPRPLIQQLAVMTPANFASTPGNQSDCVHLNCRTCCHAYRHNATRFPRPQRKLQLGCQTFNSLSSTFVYWNTWTSLTFLQLNFENELALMGTLKPSLRHNMCRAGHHRPLAQIGSHQHVPIHGPPQTLLSWH